jgi:hypothetical protein
MALSVKDKSHAEAHSKAIKLAEADPCPTREVWFRIEADEPASARDRLVGMPEAREPKLETGCPSGVEPAAACRLGYPEHPNPLRAMITVVNVQGQIHLEQH